MRTTPQLNTFYRYGTLFLLIGSLLPALSVILLISESGRPFFIASFDLSGTLAPGLRSAYFLSVRSVSMTVAVIASFLAFNHYRENDHSGSFLISVCFIASAVLEIFMVGISGLTISSFVLTWVYKVSILFAGGVILHLFSARIFRKGLVVLSVLFSIVFAIFAFNEAAFSSYLNYFIYGIVITAFSGMLFYYFAFQRDRSIYTFALFAVLVADLTAILVFTSNIAIAGILKLIAYSIPLGIYIYDYAGVQKERKQLVDQFNEELLEREKVENFLIQSEIRGKTIIESVSDGIIILNKDRKIESFNNTAEAIFGYSTAEVIEQEIMTLIPEKYQEACEKLMEDFINESKRKKTDSILEIKGRKKDGKVFPLEIAISRMSLEGELKLIFIIRDVTDAVKARRDLENYTKKLEKTNEELDQFAYIASHDLKAPLRAIASLSEWMEEDLKENNYKEVYKCLDLLKRRIIRLNYLIEGILEYTRVSKAQPAEEIVDTRKLILELWEIISPPPEFQLILPERLPVIETQLIKLQQVFSNIIDNAVKYHDKVNGKIMIRYTETNRFYEFSVIDDGPGIDKRFHQKIFQIFQKLESRDEHESTGLGLSIVKKIVEEQGGKIWLESEEGKGAEFLFTWKK